MASDDIVDDEAMIFTEGDVYMIAGYLAELWDIDVEEQSEEVAEDTERAITEVLGIVMHGR